MSGALSHAYAVILAGGRGERFWPLSTVRRPKQTLALFGGRTLLAMAVDRLNGLLDPARVLVITNQDLVAVSREAAPMLPPENVIGEPVGRDTAAACALALAVVKARDPQGVFCILTADHIIGDEDVFRRTLADGLELAAREAVLITMGITPDHPSTGYGYIEAGDAVVHTGPAPGPTTFQQARRFVEKPDAETAAGYLASGRFFWNSGMFIWSVATFEAALDRHQPDLAEWARALVPAVGTPGFADALAKAYAPLKRISVDYAIMEHADNILMARGAFAWDDVGTWPALARHFPTDEADNVCIGQTELLESSGNVVVSRDDRLTALLGVNDLVVVQAEGATLICPKSRAQDVKALVKAVGARAALRHLL